MELLFAAIAASVGVASLILWSQARQARAARGRGLLPAARDRTALTAQIGDIVGHLDRDWLVEGALALSEAPRAARLCRLMDGAEERFLYARADAEEVWLLAVLEPTLDERADEVTCAGERLRIERRWRATTLVAGRVGPRPIEPEVAVYEYASSTGRRLLCLDGAARGLALYGEALLPHALEILPGPG